jgi:hypothetical protein
LTRLTNARSDLYDGHYGAYDQGGGLRPELRIDGQDAKLVSYDEDLSASTSWEAAALQKASQAITALGGSTCARPRSRHRPPAGRWPLRA